MPRPHLLGAALSVVLSVAALPVAASADTNGATAFLRQVYSHYPQTEPNYPSSRQLRGIYDSHLYALYLASTDPGDPFCPGNGEVDCVAQVMPAQEIFPGRVQSTVVVRRTLTHETMRFHVMLTRTPAGWRVFDVIDPQAGSFRAELEDWVAHHPRHGRR